ncbi:hypothetical protein L249_8728 [Ophiocordyceps polyrhachis-furcata BCC 54312]|uniref:E2 ubiquitin-conjugating enzyme n=1 Tax=Ophiocordyceps polyrhachis-furcata BCC 54312 TaxID=1330021 RepID=A0A367L732_9HYPO|nr:hypothetical protein L249_8728 [Ophiocordyceps polyrhachis-furcata BCC 54312]
MSSKRMTKEFAEASASPPQGFTVSLDTSSLTRWNLIFAPPQPSAYHPGRYALVMTLPAEYPFRPPTIRFATPVYHPNVTNDSLGNVCLAILKPDQWKPATRLVSVLQAVASLLLEPQPDDPLEESIAEEYRSDRPAWEAKVRAHVKKHAMAEPTFPPEDDAAS